MSPLLVDLIAPFPRELKKTQVRGDSQLTLDPVRIEVEVYIERGEACLVGKRVVRAENELV